MPNSLTLEKAKEHLGRQIAEVAMFLSLEEREAAAKKAGSSVETIRRYGLGSVGKLATAEKILEELKKVREARPVAQ